MANLLSQQPEKLRLCSFQSASFEIRCLAFNAVRIVPSLEFLFDFAGLLLNQVEIGLSFITALSKELEHHWMFALSIVLMTQFNSKALDLLVS